MGGTWNSGVMVFRPDMTRFLTVFSLLMAGYTNDQPAINEAYDGHVTELEPAFNMHAFMVERKFVRLEDVVVVHFTGSPKPTFANASFQARLRRGEVFDQVYGLRAAGELYAEYFEAMSSAACFPYLSGDLRQAVRAAS